MSVLFENWMLILAAGLLVEVLLGVALYQTGRGIVLGIMAGVALLMLALLGLERLVVTDREAVAATLAEIAAALEANDADAVIARIDPAAENVRSDARAAIEQATIETARVRGLQVEFDAGDSPMRARARFRGVITLTESVGQIPYETYVGDFTVDLRRVGDRWVIYDYQRNEALDSLPSQPSSPQY